MLLCAPQGCWEGCGDKLGCWFARRAWGALVSLRWEERPVVTVAVTAPGALVAMVLVGITGVTLSASLRRPHTLGFG